VAGFENRIHDQRSTRVLFIAKYRGSPHGTDEYPFLIDHDGFKILPASATLRLRPASNEIVSSGIPDVNAMFQHGGWYRGSSSLLSGVAGSGKTMFGAGFVDVACARGERCMFFGLEEGSEENCRNVRSVGIDLGKWVAKGLLQLDEWRPYQDGIETHLMRIHRDLDRFRPSLVVIDPITAFRGADADVHMALVRMVNLLKGRGITALYTSLQSSGPIVSGMARDLSMLMDNWIRLVNVDSDGDRATALYIIKSRGMGHSKLVREYRINSAGIVLMPHKFGLREILSGEPRGVPSGSHNEPESPDGAALSGLV
jgi:circadian clock protein KaiC